MKNLLNNHKIIIIGAGIGGLTTGTLLARAGFDVTVLEAHVYPGGCAGTFFHRDYRFDAGATLAGGFYPGGPMDMLAQAAGISGWDGEPAPEAMTVHLPDGTTVTRYGDDRRHAARREAFGVAGESFWRWQEETADAMWSLALKTPPFPPQRFMEAKALAQTGLRWALERPGQMPRLALDGVRSVAARLGDAPPRLRQFVDGQLLISAQTTARHANALYGASALDLPRRGVFHLRGGMGALAQSLADALRAAGGKILYRQEVTAIQLHGGKPTSVSTKRGHTFPAGMVVANLPPANIAQLMGTAAPSHLRGNNLIPRDGWGAFMVYVGLDSAALPPDAPLHHQLLAGQPLGEGNSLFLSLSPAWDTARAPAGHRALTISTHTRLKPWWDLLQRDPNAYDARKAEYTTRIIALAEKIIPNLREASALVLPGTPVTFQRFTRRMDGWVGGYPQTNLFRLWRPQISPNIWMVGDSIFPGQSVAAVALGGIRIASAIISGQNKNNLYFYT